MTTEKVEYIPMRLSTVDGEQFIAWPIQVRVPSAGEFLEFEDVGHLVTGVNWDISKDEGVVSVQLVCA